jgi:hypothetical protein
MGHKFKKLGVSLVAVLALSLAITSLAAAAQFTASSYPASAIKEGSSEYGTVTTEGGSVECEHGSASATLSAASSTLTITEGAVSGCKAFGFSGATVTNGECSVLIHITGGSGDTYTGSSDLLCPAGKAIVTTAGTCKMETKPQNGSVTITLTNNTGEGTVGVKLKTANVAYTVTQDGFLCPFSGTGNKTGGSYKEVKPGLISIAGKTVSIS